MTDDESRKAFESWMKTDGPYPSSGTEEMVWQAAWQEATKRERERCAKMLEEVLAYEDINVQMSLRGLIDEIEEPKS